MSRLLNPEKVDFLIKTASEIFMANPLKSERTRHNVWCRTALYLILNDDGNSYKSIGNYFGKDRGTVVYCIKRHPDLLKYDKEYEMYFNEFILSIRETMDYVHIVESLMDQQINNLDAILKSDAQ